MSKETKTLLAAFFFFILAVWVPPFFWSLLPDGMQWWKVPLAITTVIWGGLFGLATIGVFKEIYDESTK